MSTSFSYVRQLHPVASNWRLPQDPIAADGAVQHTDRLLRLLRRKNRQDDDGGQRGAARHKIFALQFEDFSLGYKGSGTSASPIREAFKSRSGTKSYNAGVSLYT